MTHPIKFSLLLARAMDALFRRPGPQPAGWSPAITLCLSLTIGLASFPVAAQHAMHDMATSDLITHSMPADDAVLAAAPESLMLHFGSEVRLVKLALRNADSEFLDIGFRYDPQARSEFHQQLPSLSPSDYYRIEWGVVDRFGTLSRGQIHFSFGESARPPSYWLDQQEQMRHIMSPDYRLLDPQVR